MAGRKVGKTAYEALQIEQGKRELAKRYYIDYLRYVHKAQWKDTRFAVFVANTIQKFVQEESKNAYDILILESPPQHGKSMTVTESFPSWYLGKFPRKRVIEVSYNEETATRFLRRNKEKIKEFGDDLFGIKPGGADNATVFELQSGGSMRSAGVQSSITGNPADLLIIDDPIKNREEADSETTRNKVWGEWLNSMKSRLQAHAKVILIMTPWHEDDIRARILKTEKNVTRLRFPVEAEEHDALGRKPGEPLCPELGKDKIWLEQFKESYLSDDQGGPRAWSALYMCNPVIEGGNMVQRSWWKYYDPDDPDLQVFGTEIMGVDATFKDSDTSDYVSIQAWGKLRGNYYLRYCGNKRLSFIDTVKQIKQVKQMFPNVSRICIEDKANGSAIIQTLYRTFSNIVPVNPLGGKIARLQAVSTFIEVGHVFVPKNAPWLEDYLKQFSEFPAGKHDDMVDCSTMSLKQLEFAWDIPPVGKTEEDEIEEAAMNDFLSAGNYNVYGEYGGDDFFDTPSLW